MLLLSRRGEETGWLWQRQHGTASFYGGAVPCSNRWEAHRPRWLARRDASFHRQKTVQVRIQKSLPFMGQDEQWHETIEAQRSESSESHPNAVPLGLYHFAFLLTFLLKVLGRLVERGPVRTGECSSCRSHLLVLQCCSNCLLFIFKTKTNHCQALHIIPCLVLMQWLQSSPINRTPVYIMGNVFS